MAIVFWMQYQWQYQYQLFVEYNTNCNTNTNCFWNAISMAIPIPIVCVIQYQWQYQYQFFFLCNFNINCNSNTFNCLRTNSNVQAINSYWNLPISIAIPIVPDLHKQLSMAMAIPSKTAIPMAPQYYCSCLLSTYLHKSQPCSFLNLHSRQWKVPQSLHRVFWWFHQHCMTLAKVVVLHCCLMGTGYWFQLGKGRKGQQEPKIYGLSPPSWSPDSTAFCKIADSP